MIRHFLADDDLTPAEQAEVLALAAHLKASPYASSPLAGPLTVATIYDKPTLRTQASFAAGIAELGGHPMLIDGALAGIGKRESIADVTRVLARQASAIVWRTYAQSAIEKMASYSTVPVINALTDRFHPCQLLADLLTVIEHKGALSGLSAAFVGDAASNMANSWQLAGATAGMHVRICGPETHAPDSEVMARAQRVADVTGGSVSLFTDPQESVVGADIVVTDTWVSMGREDEGSARLAAFSGYGVDSALMSRAPHDAIVMHCLPAYRGKEIAAEVIDGPQSVVWDEAENRRHVQKAVISWLLKEARR
jgi:ornithine carbamoyltransferase